MGYPEGAAASTTASGSKAAPAVREGRGAATVAEAARRRVRPEATASGAVRQGD
jgi:hypothetical protein